MKNLVLAIFLALSLAACDSPAPADGGTDAGGTDAGGMDGGAGMDAGPLDDAGSTDGGGPSDGGGSDAGGDIDGRPVSPMFGAIVFNEVLTDGTAEGDPNGDGDANPVEDQFVELVSTGGSVDMSGFTLVEQDLPDLPRHTFAGGFVLSAGHAVVVFGGGDAPDATATTTFFVANAADPGLPFGLHLSTPADTMWLLDAGGAVVARFCVGGDGECALDAASDESLTRDPDVTGAFVPHREATGSGGEAFSVGTRVDGSAF